MQETRSAIPAFLSGGGEMGELTRSFNWSATPVGDFAQWPQSLSTTVGILLRSRFPMFLWWGPELICFYNDAYRPSLGNNGKHPSILGMPAKEAWPEIWDMIRPLIDQVLADGEAIWAENQLVPIYRNGKIEDVYWTFSYSPVNIEDGKVGGVLVVCTETTDNITTLERVKEARDQLSFAIDAADLGTWELNVVTNRFTGNDRLKDWFGLEPGEEIDLQLAINAMAEKDRPKVVEAIGYALQFASGGAYDIEYTIVNARTGQERNVKAKGKAFFDEQQQPIRFSGTLQDITGEVDAREQQQKLFTLVDNSVDLMAILRMDGTNGYINAAGRELLGIEEDADATQIPISDFHTPEQYAFVSSVILPAVMTTGRWAGQFEIRNGKTGEIIPLYNNCHRIDDLRTGEPIGVGTIMRDMRPELNARKELAENEERLNIAINTTELGMWELNYKSGQLFCNKRYLEILGFEGDKVPPHEEIRQCIHPDDVDRRNEAVQNAITTGILDIEFRVVYPDATVHWVKGKGKVLYDKEQRPEKQLGTIMDITEQKTMAQQLEQKVQERTRALQAANEELEKKNGELASFAYVSSHDLQEPLRKIQTFISWIEDKEGDTLTNRGRDYFEKIKGSANRMQTLINDLLSFSRTDTVEKEFVATDINLLLEDVQKDLQESIQRSQAVIEVSALPPLQVIVFQFHQLFTNLVTNAIKFARKGEPPHITISGEYMHSSHLPHLPVTDSPYYQYYRITVADNGIGFDPEYSTRIFEVFQRLHGRSEYEGTGIGLAICKKIVENHHGFIVAESQLGEGARFYVYVPV